MCTNVYLCFSVARLQSRSSWGNDAIWHIVLSASTFVYHHTIRGESRGVALASSLIHANSREPGGPAEQKPADANTVSHSSHIHCFFPFQWAVGRWRPVVFKNTYYYLRKSFWNQFCFPKCTLSFSFFLFIFRILQHEKNRQSKRVCYFNSEMLFP